MPPPSSSSSSPANWEPLSPEELHRLLPQYEITEMIGLGGMGAVYKGRQENLDRDVAIKVLCDTVVQADDEFDFAARFKQEAQAMAKLDHPAIVSVIDFGETSDGHLYLVMEFIDGMDIQHYLQHHGGHLPQEQALSITAHVLDALGYAHSKGIIHRDIKPANILLRQDGRVKIADFGLAKTFGKGKEEANFAMTTTNATVGTPDFVAPEALGMDNVVDQRADLYAVGVMLYRMLTGKLPRESFKMPSELFPELDQRLDDIVEKATESDPDYRYATAEELRADIDAVVSQPISRIEAASKVNMVAKEVTEPAKKSKLKRALYIVGGISIAALLLLGGIAKLFLPEQRKGGGGTVVDGAQKTSTQANEEGKGKEVSQVKFDGVVVRETSRATKGMPFENSLDMRFVPVPITGGASDGKRVLFSIWETRLKDFEVFNQSSPRVNWPTPSDGQDPYEPVVNVDWDEAVAFCEWLTELERKSGRIGKNDAYRLPTDHEWSCAVGIGQQEDASLSPSKKHQLRTNVYPWGESFPPQKGDGNYYGEEAMPRGLSRAIPGYNDGFPEASKVGSFDANEFGLYDMGGNVREWGQDLFDPPLSENRVARGMSWAHSMEGSLVSSYRGDFSISSRYAVVGFRVVLEGGDNEEMADIGRTVEGAKSVLTGGKPGEELENGIEMKLCWIPPGNFIIGSPPGEEGREDEKEAQVEADLTKAFWIGKYEVTQKEYAALMGENPSGFQENSNRHPVEQVNWIQAMEFCKRLTEVENKNGNLSEGWSYTLPTETQWEYACRAGSEGPYYSSDLNKVCWYKDNSDGVPHKVGQKLPNKWGLHDMHGNIREWCFNWFVADHKGGMNPQSPARGVGRTHRGGSWLHPGAGCRSADRDMSLEIYTSSRLGFRVALVYEGPSTARNGKLDTGNPGDEDCCVLIASMASEAIASLNLGTGEVTVIHKFEDKAGPKGIAVLQSGEIYVSLRYGGMNVMKLTPRDSGGFEVSDYSKRIGAYGPGKLRIADTGELLVSGDATGSIFRVDLESGKFKESIGNIGMSNAVGMDVSGKDVYAAEVFGGRIAHFTLKENGALENWLVNYPDAALKRSTGITIGHNGNLYVTNTESSAIPVFSSKKGDYIGVFYDVKEIGANTADDIRYVPALNGYIVASEGHLLRLDLNGKLLRKYPLYPKIIGATAIVVVDKKQLDAVLAKKL